MHSGDLRLPPRPEMNLWAILSLNYYFTLHTGLKKQLLGSQSKTVTLR